MKNPFILPAVTAALGFAIAWALKPAPEPASSPGPAADLQQTEPRQSPRSTTERRPQGSMAENRPKEVGAGNFPLLSRAESQPKSRTEGKMLRLTEALGLSFDQQNQILAALEESKTTDTGDAPALDEFTIRGRELEQKLTAILSTEQLQEFNEIRKRERDNRIETRASKILNLALEDIDLSPGQRDEVLARLRQQEKERVQGIPAAATLLLNTSVLPTEEKSLSIDALLLLNEIDSFVPSDDPLETHNRVLDRQRQMIEDELACFDGILSPAQMGQYYAALSTRIASIEDIRSRRSDRPRFVPAEEDFADEPEVEFDPDIPAVESDLEAFDSGPDA